VVVKVVEHMVLHGIMEILLVIQLRVVQVLVEVVALVQVQIMEQRLLEEAKVILEETE
jgi:hypothetical protein